MEPLLFLIKLAWACRYRLPLLITVGFMALDIRMQLEIHVQMRRIRRGPPLPLRGGRNPHDAQPDSARNRNNSEDSSSSWLTVDEDEPDLDDSLHYGDIGETSVPGTSRQMDWRERPTSYLNSPDISQTLDNLLDVNLEN